MVAILALMAMSGSAAGQGEAQARIDAIWAAADARMAQQLDVWFDDGEFPAIVQLLTMRSELRPHDYETATDLGWMLENIDRDDEAILVYEKYLKANPGSADAALPVAQYWFLKKDYPKVIKILEPGIQNEAHPNNFRILAHAYDRTGKFAESVKMWERYIALNPSDSAAKVNLTRVQNKLKGGASPPAPKPK